MAGFDLFGSLRRRVAALELGFEQGPDSPEPWSAQEEAIARGLAQAHNVPFASATDLLRELDVAQASHVSHAFREKHRVAPIRLDGEIAVVASDGPPASERRLARMLGAEGVAWQITTASGLQRLHAAIDVGELTQDRARQPSETDAADDLLAHDLAKQTEAVSVLESILIEAAAERASDIHLEHVPGRVRVRVRVDGSLRELGHYALTAAQVGPIVRIAKVRGGIDIAEQRRPSGGQFEMRVGRRRYFIRVQSQPTVLGENLVMRLLPQDPSLENIEQLGFSAPAALAYRRLLDNPGGLLLVVGPTGSGKTTTLYAGLRVVAADGERKVITIEDPVETVCPGAQQVQVSEEADFDFEDAMRAFVREDPDVIMLGEIRDTESALEAIRASQTGHLVLSSLHSNDAIDAVQRLRDLGMNSNSIATELTAIFAQRLARRICTECREPAVPDPEVVREVFPHGIPSDFEAFRGAGCERCRGTGSYGRVAVVECLTAGPGLRRAIARGDLVDDLRAQACESGLVTLRDRALELAKAGVIAFHTLPRLIPLERLAPPAAEAQPTQESPASAD